MKEYYSQQKFSSSSVLSPQSSSPSQAHKRGMHLPLPQVNLLSVQVVFSAKHKRQVCNCKTFTPLINVKVEG